MYMRCYIAHILSPEFILLSNKYYTGVSFNLSYYTNTKN